MGAEKFQNFDSSIIWKVVLNCFSMIGEGMAWKIDNRSKVRIGSDPWEGSGLKHLFP
jgi:hypothetical protein